MPRNEQIPDVIIFSERGYGTREDYLVLPLDLLAYNTHRGLVDTVLKYFKRVGLLVTPPMLLRLGIKCFN